MGSAIAFMLGVVVLLAWVVIAVARYSRLARVRASRAVAVEALAEFAEISLELQSVPDILAFAGDAARAAFGCERVVTFEPGAEAGEWDAVAPRQGELPAVPAAARGTFGWFKHNTAIAARADLGAARFGAMRGPLEQLMTGYGVDLMMPLVDRKQILGCVGIALGRTPSTLERELLRQLRLEVTAACANVRLHREAAHMVSLAREVDLASAVQQALVPQRDEQGVGWLSWAGHFRQAGEAGSDFWHAYPLSDDRVLVVIGDATGAGLGGSMVSAVVKSCCDSFAGARGARLEPDELLAAINRALWRPRKPIHMTCFAAVFDNEQRRLRFASAGHRFPYTVTSKGLSVLRGAGPVLGDDFDSTYRTMSQPFAVGDTFVLYTNGVVEARNAAGVAWGERRMQKQLQQLALGYVASVTGVRDAIRAAADAHSGDIAVADDQAMVIVRVER